MQLEYGFSHDVIQCPKITERLSNPSYSIEKTGHIDFSDLWSERHNVEYLIEHIVLAAEAKLKSFGEQITPEHRKAFEVGASIIAQMACGTAPQKYFNLPLPMGAGKTTALTVESVRLLCSSPLCADIGIAIFVQRKEQVRELYDALIDPNNTISPPCRPEQIAVRTGKDNEELNSLGIGEGQMCEGSQKHNVAQVLITTHAKLLSLANYMHQFEHSKFFSYIGSPRQVRIWDEALIPIEPLHLTTQQLISLGAEMLTWGFDQGQAVIEWSKCLEGNGGQSVHVPNLVAAPYESEPRYWYDDEGLLKALEQCSRDDKSPLAKVADGFLKIIDRYVSVTFDEKNGTTTISYSEILPKELTPILFLSAGAHKREAFGQWKKGRGDLIVLDTFEKDYSNLTVYHWDFPAGIECHGSAQHRRKLADAAVEAFFVAPEGEQVLFFLRLAFALPLEKLIRTKIKEREGNPELAVFETYGRHDATNEYRDIKHSVHIGVFQKPHSHYLALGRGCGKVPAHIPINDAKSKDITRDVRLSEVAQEMLQAVGRTAVRKLHPPEGCTVHMIFSTKGRLGMPRSVLAETFPGARVLPWREETDPRHEQAREMSAQGCSLRQIAQAVGVGSPQTIKNWLSKVS